MPPADADFAILVLGAGKGSRMGGHKIVMNVGGRPWFEWQRERLERVLCRTLWMVPVGVPGLSNPPDAPAARGISMATAWGGDNAPMFMSFLAGLYIIRSGCTERRAGGLFVLPIDTPAPAPRVWHRLATSGRVAVPSFRGSRGHPVFLPWTWIADRIMPAVDAAHPSTLRLDHLIAPDITLIEVDDPDVAVNLNTPDDVVAWLARSAHP